MKSAIITALITVVLSIIVVLVIDSLGDDKPNQPQHSSVPDAPFPTYKVQ